MIINTFASSLEDLRACAQTEHCKEVLIETSALSRLGKLSLEQACELAIKARELGLRSVLVWDVLLSQRDFREAENALRALDLTLFSSIRVRDVGAAHWVLEKALRLGEHAPKLQLLCESANNNLQALLGWERYFGETLERLVLSLELPESTLLEYCASLRTQLEVLGAGRIEIFYSPRKLLSPHFETEEDNLIEVRSSSLENHERDFPTIESSQGTMMYLDKDHFILDKCEKLKNVGLHALRIDLRHLSSAGNAADGIARYAALPWQKEAESLSALWPVKTAATFFKSNKTDKQIKIRGGVLIEKRKNASSCAEVIASENGKFVMYRALRDFELGSDEMRLDCPNGKNFSLEHLRTRDLEQQLKQSFVQGELFLTRWLASAVPGAVLRVADGSAGGVAER